MDVNCTRLVLINTDCCYRWLTTRTCNVMTCHSLWVRSPLTSINDPRHLILRFRTQFSFDSGLIFFFAKTTTPRAILNHNATLDDMSARILPRAETFWLACNSSAFSEHSRLRAQLISLALRSLYAILARSSQVHCYPTSPMSSNANANCEPPSIVHAFLMYTNSASFFVKFYTLSAIW